MKHAGDAALDQLDELLQAVRKQAALREKKRGIFYRKSSAFLHFHEDPEGLFADLRTGSGWSRLRINTRAERKALIARVKSVLSESG